MATIHPSRLGLVPQEQSKMAPSREDELRRQLTERRSATTLGINQSNDDNPREQHFRQRNDERYYMPRENDRTNGHGGQGHEHETFNRRRSPIYHPYEARGPSRDGGLPVSTVGHTPNVEETTISTSGRYRGDKVQTSYYAEPPPWRNMGSQAALGSGSMNLEQRRQTREHSDISIWPPSPKRSFEEDQALNAKSQSKLRKSKSRRHRKRRYSSEEDTDSEDEYDRERLERRRRKRKEKERERNRRSSHNREDEEHSREAQIQVKDDTKWIEKNKGNEPEKDSNPLHNRSVVDDINDTEVGPQLPVEHQIKDNFNREAFRDLLPGEGAAMQAFLEKGERIPRRGEIGLDSAQIAAFEDAGYVMSGSRHQRMNAVRLRKENQVINAEEKRSLLKLQREEREKKEGAIISQFKEMMDERLKIEERRQRDHK